MQVLTKFELLNPTVEQCSGAPVILDPLQTLALTSMAIGVNKCNVTGHLMALIVLERCQQY